MFFFFWNLFSNIFCDSSLLHNMINNKNNNSHYSNISVINSIFSETQMQMLQNMIVQTKKDDCVKKHIKTTNSHCTTDLSYYSDWSDWYLNWWNQFQHHWYDSESEDSDNFNELISNILNTFCRCCLTDEDNYFWFKKVKFFNSHLNIKNYDFSNIINADEKIYFYNIHLFIDFFKDITHTKTDRVVH